MLAGLTSRWTPPLGGGAPKVALGLDPPDELRVVGQPGTHPLHRHLPPHLRLESPVDRPEGAGPDLLEESVPAERLSSHLEGEVLPEDLLLQPLECRGGIDAELLGEDLTGAAVGGKGVALPAGSVKSEHQLAPQPLPQWMQTDEGLQFGDELGVSPQG